MHTDRERIHFYVVHFLINSNLQSYIQAHTLYSQKPQSSVFAPWETATYLKENRFKRKLKNISLDMKLYINIRRKGIEFIGSYLKSMGFQMHAHIYLTSFMDAHQPKPTK